MLRLSRAQNGTWDVIIPSCFISAEAYKNHGVSFQRPDVKLLAESRWRLLFSWPFSFALLGSFSAAVEAYTKKMLISYRSSVWKERQPLRKTMKNCKKRLNILCCFSMENHSSSCFARDSYVRSGFLVHVLRARILFSWSELVLYSSFVSIRN